MSNKMSAILPGTARHHFSASVVCAHFRKGVPPYVTHKIHRSHSDYRIRCTLPDQYLESAALIVGDLLADQAMPLERSAAACDLKIIIVVVVDIIYGRDISFIIEFDTLASHDMQQSV